MKMANSPCGMAEKLCEIAATVWGTDLHSALSDDDLLGCQLIHQLID